MLINVEDYHKKASKVLPRSIFDLVAGGSESESTLRRNRAVFEKFMLKPRILVDVSHRDLSVTVCGTKIDFPVILAPTGVGQACWPWGDIMAGKAASQMGTIFTASTLTGPSLEVIAQGCPGPLWFQLYIWKDRKVVQSLIERARKAGYNTLVLTVDVPVFGARERDVRHKLILPPKITFNNAFESLRHPGWLWRWLFSPRHTMGNLENVSGVNKKDLKIMGSFLANNMDPSVNWKDLEWFRSQWPGPFLLKGIICPEDAVRAANAGVDGIIVSNHGGRQLDGAISSLEALPDVVDAVSKYSMDVLFDGGIMRGTDVIKALALGAKAVMVGKPYLFGLAVNGEDGVVSVLKILKAEIERSMALVGVQSVSELNRSYIARGF